MKEFIIELLQAVAAAAVPVCAAFLVQFLRRKSEEIGAQVSGKKGQPRSMLPSVDSALHLSCIRKENAFSYKAQDRGSE